MLILWTLNVQNECIYLKWTSVWSRNWHPSWTWFSKVPRILKASVAPAIAASEEQSDKWIIDQTSWLHRVINTACNSASGRNRNSFCTDLYVYICKNICCGYNDAMMYFKLRRWHFFATCHQLKTSIFRHLLIAQTPTSSLLNSSGLRLWWAIAQVMKFCTCSSWLHSSMAPCSWSSRRCLKSLEILCTGRERQKHGSPSTPHHFPPSATWQYLPVLHDSLRRRSVPRAPSTARSAGCSEMNAAQKVRVGTEGEKVITSSCSINRLARLLSSFIIIIFAILIWFSAFLCVIFIPWSLDKWKENEDVCWLLMKTSKRV